MTDKEKNNNCGVESKNADACNCTECQYGSVRADGVICSYAPLGLGIFLSHDILPFSAHCNRFVKRKSHTR